MFRLLRERKSTDGLPYTLVLYLRRSQQTFQEKAPSKYWERRIDQMQPLPGRPGQQDALAMTCL